MAAELNEKQIEELKRLKAYFPFRIVFGVIGKDGAFEAYAKADKRVMNKLAKEGNSVFRLG